MKKKINLSVCMLILLLSSIVGCAKEPMNVPVTPVTDTIANTDTLPSKDSLPAADTTKAPSAGIKFLALGDSYTIGQSVQQSERFPAQTVELLKAQNLLVSPQYIAQTGWTTTNLMYAINAQPPATDFDIVTLLIGVNDQYQHRDTTAYAAKFEELLNKAVFFAGGRKMHVFVLSIPDYSATPFVSANNKAAVSTQIEQFNAINKKITLQYNIAYIDITPSTQEAANDPSLIAFDDLHPSRKEYKKWAEMLAPLIQHVLK